MGLFSGRKALASSTFLGIGANPPADPARVPPAPGATTTAPSAPPAPPAAVTTPAAQQPAGTKAAKSTKKGKKSGSEDGEEGEDDEEDNEDEDGDDDSDEEEMRRGPSSTLFRARSRERARISAILGHPAAARNPDFAAHVALNTNNGRRAACALLDSLSSSSAPAATKPAGGTLAERMEHFRGIAAPPSGPGASAEEAQKTVLSEAFAKHAVTAAKKA